MSCVTSLVRPDTFYQNRYLVLYQFALSFCLLVLHIGQQPMETGSVENVCYLKKRQETKWFCRVNRKTAMLGVRKKQSFETKWRKCGDEMKCAEVRVWNNLHTDLPKCF